MVTYKFTWINYLDLLLGEIWVGVQAVQNIVWSEIIILVCQWLLHHSFSGRCNKQELNIGHYWRLLRKLKCPIITTTKTKAFTHQLGFATSIYLYIMVMRLNISLVNSLILSDSNCNTVVQRHRYIRIAFTKWLLNKDSEHV